MKKQYKNCEDDCRMCSGEMCNKCGAGCWNDVIMLNECFHDVEERHCTEKKTLSKVNFMGAWGEKATENDTGQDYFLELNSIFEDHLLKVKNKNSDYDKTRIIAEIILRFDSDKALHFESKLLDLVLKKLIQIKNDNQYIESWICPSKIIKELEQQINDITLLMSDYNFNNY